LHFLYKGKDAATWVEWDKSRTLDACIEQLL
jgi:hypothetical protein